MKLTRKQLKPLGFKGTHVFDSNWHAHWYRSFPKACAVVGINCISPEGIWKTALTPAQMRSFSRGGISIEIPGCCGGATGHTCIEGNRVWFYQGEIKNTKHLHELLASTKLFPELSPEAQAAPKKPKQDPFADVLVHKQAYERLIEEERDMAADLAALHEDHWKVRRRVKAAKRAWDKAASKLVG